MAKYYAQITGNATITTNFKPYTEWTNNNKYLRLEYNGDITTTAGGICPFFAGQSPWFCLVQDDLNRYTNKQYLNIGSTVYFGTGYSWNTNGFESTTVMTFGDATASIVKGTQSHSGSFSGNIPNNNLAFFSNYANNLQMNFFELKAYGANNTLLFDFVPDYNGTTKGILDKVSGSFFDAAYQSKIELIPLSTFEIAPTETAATFESGTTTITVNTDNNSTITWTASTSDSWLSLSPSTGSGDGSVVVTYAKNAALQDRTGTVTFTSSEGDELTFTIEQEKKPALVYDHPIYRSGNLVKKMYRSGELIYVRLNPPTE